MPSSGGTNHHLPSLDLESNGINGSNSNGLGTGHQGQNGRSASLRGQHHSRVPDISNQPLNTLLPILKYGYSHPDPYYITQNVV